jgi:hypothetical protein
VAGAVSPYLLPPGSLEGTVGRPKGRLPEGDLGRRGWWATGPVAYGSLRLSVRRIEGAMTAGRARERRGAPSHGGRSSRTPDDGPRAAAERYVPGETPLDGRVAVPLLQRSVGNRAVGRLLNGEAPAVQRVPITAPTRRETLFNQRGTPGQASPAVYGGSGGVTFDMTRGGTPESVTVTVKIRFFDRARTATGGNTGSRTVIPAGDPRRAWAQGICTQAPNVWNGRARLVGRRRPATGLAGMVAPDPGGPVWLPLSFRAVPVWDLASPADAEVAVFGSATVAGGPQDPIDAGHYYMNRGRYPFTEEQIYAHEYGHLIGLPDEYSQSNPEMHAVLHDIDPGTSAARGAALDRETVRRMVMAALTRPLFLRLSGASGEISAALLRGAAPMRQALAGQLRVALTSPAVRSLFAANLPPTSARLARRVGALVAAATGAVRNSRGVAAAVVAGELAPAALGALIGNQYWAALMGVHGAADVGGGLSVNITIEGGAGGPAATGVWNAASGGAMAANASAETDRVVGALQTGRVPPVRPSGALLRQLESLPTGWAAFSAAAPAALASTTLEADLTTALTAAWVARMVSGGGAAIARGPALASAVDGAVRTAARTAATNAVRAFLSAEINPVLQTSVTALMSAVGDEVTRIMTTPAGALAAAAPKDPDLAAMAATLNSQLQTQAAVAGAVAAVTPGSTQVDPGSTAPPQAVTYGTVNMMSDNASVFRVDQFAELATQFNGSGLRSDREDSFHAEKI